MPANDEPHLADEPITGIGLGLRWEFIDDVDAGWSNPSLRFFEVAPENYMRRGGCFPAALARIAQRHPLLTHGLMLDIGGADELDADYLARLRVFLELVGARRHTDHLCWTRRSGQYLHDLLPLRFTSATARYVAERVMRVQDVLGLPLALENISYYGAPDEPMAERDFVCEVLERADCGLLLDVNNVYVNAQNHGFAALEYLRALPLHRVVQLHVAGGERRASLHDMLIDTHGTDVPAPVFELMAWVVEQIGPVPVLYERDHDIPEVSELGRQVEALDKVYCAALARYCASPSDGGRALDPAQAHGHGQLAGYQCGVSHLILRNADAPESVPDVLEGLARCEGLTDEDSRVVASVGATPLSVYRALVRSTLTSVIETFMPRTHVRFGETFGEWTARWLAAVGSVSPYLSDVPLEFLDWAEPRWRCDDDVPEYLPDLARHEVTDFEVGAAHRGHESSVVGEDALTLSSHLVFDPSVRTRRYAFAVHELLDDEGSRLPPQRRDTLLLCYRDDAHQVRYMALSAMAMAFVERLSVGEALEPALRRACEMSGEPLDDEILVRMSQFLADLAERGVVHGVAAEK